LLNIANDKKTIDMKKRLFMMCLTMLIAVLAWADEPYTEFEYNGIVVIDGLKYAVTLPEDGKGEALLMGADDSNAATRAATRGIIAVQLLPELKFKEKDVQRVKCEGGRCPFIMPPPYGIIMEARKRQMRNKADSDLKYDTTGSVDPDKEYTTELTVIGYSALQGNTDITELTIPEGVTTIWGSAFDGCTNLQKVTLPSTLLSLGFRAFADCISLTEINIPNSVVEIQPGAFMNCRGLTNVSLSTNLTEIPQYLFHRCENLKIVTGGDAATRIGPNAFEYCYKLTDFTLPSALDSICDRAFLYCQNLTSITIPRTLSGFGVKAFSGCTRLKNVTFESGGTALKEINEEVFCSSGITSVEIPNSVERIRYQAFAFSDLANATFSSKLIEIGDSAFHWTKLISVSIPATVTKIRTGAFDSCEDLANLVFESGSQLRDIGDNAFFATAITELTIPDGVTTIGESAFSVCENLESLTLSKQLTSMGEEAFMECWSLISVTAPMTSPFAINKYHFTSTTYNNGTLYVPKGTKSLYLETDGWSRFVNIVEAGLAPMEDQDEIDYAEDGNVDENTNLEGTIIDNVYYNISPDDGGFDAEDKCIVVNNAMSDEEIESVFGKDLQSDEVKQTYTGLVIMVPAGKGNLMMNAQATGGMTLKVKIGSADPLTLEFDGKMKVTVPYNVIKPTYVYIYAGESAAASRRKTGGANDKSLRIYGIGIDEDEIMNGDVNDDGSVDIADAVCIVNHIVGKPTSEFVYASADVNSDVTIDIADAVRIVNFIVRKIDALARRPSITLPEPE
jgi:hypothetical protein